MQRRGHHTSDMQRASIVCTLLLDEGLLCHNSNAQKRKAIKRAGSRIDPKTKSFVCQSYNAHTYKQAHTRTRAHTKAKKGTRVHEAEYCTRTQDRTPTNIKKLRKQMHAQHTLRHIRARAHTSKQAGRHASMHDHLLIFVCSYPLTTLPVSLHPIHKHKHKRKHLLIHF